MMHERIVYEKINEAVGRDAKACCKRPRRPAKLGAPCDQRDGNRSEKEAEQIVQFESALAGFMMALVQEPEEAVHGIFMRDPGHAFHCEEHGEEKRRIEKPIVHARSYP